MTSVEVLGSTTRGPFRASRSTIRDQPGPGGHMYINHHIATGGLVCERDDDDEPVPEFGDYEQIIHSREVDKDPYRSRFAGFDAPVGSGPLGNLLGGSNAGGSGSGGFGTGGPSGSGGFNGPGGGSGPGNIDPNNFIDNDNPSLPPGPNRITVGVEFEFALAVSRRFKGLQDPHPNDGRWQSENLVTEKEDDPLFLLSLRNLVIDTLRRNGVVASKTREDEIGLDTEEQGWLFDLNDGKQSPNIPVLIRWQGYYRWDQQKSLEDNCVSAAQELSAQFIAFHNDNGLELHRTTEEVLIDISERRLPFFIDGLAYAVHLNRWKINDDIAKNWISIIKNEQSQQEEREGKFVDSNCVQIPGANPNYYAWTCTIDESIAINSAAPQHYVIPDGSIPPSANPTFNAIARPPRSYKWWPGELKSPIYDYDNPATLETIRKACAALRDNYRIHKPMATIGTGLHIHFGQERGWTLLQLKKFTTLWLILEEAFEKMHRQDRSDNEFSGPLRALCPISYALFASPAISHQYRQYLPDTKNRNPQLSYEYTQLMNLHLPFDLPISGGFTQDIREMIAEIWQYDTISGLNEGMTGYKHYGYVMYRLKGRKVTTGADKALQTLEVRIMQGTLDADHIWRWMSICQGLIRFSRDSNPQEYNNGLREILVRRENPAHIFNIPEAYIQWFHDQKDDTGYFAYPDADKVNWANPFMVPGYADVYTGMSSL